MNRSIIENELTKDEARRHSVYIDSIGILTCGIGFALEVKDGAGTIIPSTVAQHICQQVGVDYDKLFHGEISLTDEQIDAIRDIQINTAIFDARHLVSKIDTLPNGVGNAIVNMSFQLGYAKLAGFKQMLAALNSDPPNYEEAANQAQASHWFGQSGNRGREVVAAIRGGV